MILQVSWNRGHEKVNILSCNSSGVAGKSPSSVFALLLYFIHFLALLPETRFSYKVFPPWCICPLGFAVVPDLSAGA